MNSAGLGFENAASGVVAWAIPRALVARNLVTQRRHVLLEHVKLAVFATASRVAIDSILLQSSSMQIALAIAALLRPRPSTGAIRLHRRAGPFEQGLELRRQRFAAD